jgi:hypothetical protein
MDSILVRGILLFLMAMGCGNSPLVVVTIHGDRSNVAQLEALLTLNGQNAMSLESFAASATEFAVQLPDGARGQLKITVAGVDSRNCIVSFAIATVEAGGQSRIDVTVTLGAVSPPQCS